MIHIHFQDTEVQELVRAAVVRSVTSAQVSEDLRAADVCSIFIGDAIPTEDNFTKVIVFGAEPSTTGHLTVLARYQDLSPVPMIQFEAHALTQALHLKVRHFERYDFAREWNNLGYGRIEPAPHTPWSVGQSSTNGQAFAWVSDEPHRTILWYNRNVGPIDGFDWRMIEDFLSEYQDSKKIFATCPVLSEIPSGYSGALTFRIDCDENIASGRPLFELYRDHHFPFSLAIKTDQPIPQSAILLMKEIISGGGAIVSHSHTHAPDWGKQNAFNEALESRAILEQILSKKIRYAVSPFHQNSRVAVDGIFKGGLEAFVSGIICNDPEYLMARSGAVPFISGPISHSQQCMLHGDCYHDGGHSIQIYAEAFLNALSTETFFGYLDHPFSNYQYGWLTEQERLGVHEQFLKLVHAQSNLWFASLDECLDFLWDRAHATIKIQGTQIVHHRASTRSSKALSARWNGQRFKLA